MLGVSGAAVSKWPARGCPRNQDGSYDLAEVCRWMRSGGLDLDRIPQDRTIQVMGVTRPTIGAWEQRGCPRNEDGSYNLALVVQWRAKELEERLSVARGQLTGHRARREAALAEKAEIELKEAKGDLLPRTAIVAGWVARYGVIAAQVQTLLRRAATYGLTAEQLAALETDVDAIMGELSRPQTALQLTEAESAVLGAGPAAPDAEAEHG